MREDAGITRVAAGAARRRTPVVDHEDRGWRHAADARDVRAAGRGTRRGPRGAAVPDDRSVGPRPPPGAHGRGCARGRSTRAGGRRPRSQCDGPRAAGSTSSSTSRPRRPWSRPSSSRGCTGSSSSFGGVARRPTSLPSASAWGEWVDVRPALDLAPADRPLDAREPGCCPGCAPAAPRRLPSRSARRARGAHRYGGMARLLAAMGSDRRGSGGAARPALTPRRARDASAGPRLPPPADRATRDRGRTPVVAVAAPASQDEARTAPRASAKGSRFAGVKPATLIRPWPTT